MPASAQQTVPVTYNIQLNSQGTATSSPTVKAGDKVQWTASVDSWVDPPTIFAACNSRIDIPAGQTLPNPPCVVTGNPGTYDYTSGIGSEEDGVGSGNDTITVEA